MSADETRQSDEQVTRRLTVLRAGVEAVRVKYEVRAATETVRYVRAKDVVADLAAALLATDEQETLDEDEEVAPSESVVMAAFVAGWFAHARRSHDLFVEDAWNLYRDEHVRIRPGGDSDA